MRLYGKCGKADPCHDRRHCNPWRGSRTREKRISAQLEDAADEGGPRKRRRRQVR